MTFDLPAWTPAEPGALPALPVARGSSGVVALVASEGAIEAGWAGEVALELAEGWSSKGARLVLADGGLGVPCLHTAAGLTLGEGLVDALRWGASVRRIARRLEGRSFFVVTAGTATADGLAVLEDPRWAALCSGFREAGVTLAVLVPIADPCVRAVLAQSTAAVILATQGEDASDVLPGWDRPILGVVGREPPPPPPPPAEPAADTAALPKIDVPGPLEAVDVSPEGGVGPFPVLDAVTDLAVPLEAPSPEEPALSLFDIPEVPEAAPEPEEPLAPGPEPVSEAPAPPVVEALAEPLAETRAPEPQDEGIPVTDDAEAQLFATAEDELPQGVPTFEEIVEETEAPQYVEERRSHAWLLPLVFLLLLLAGAGAAWWLGYLDIPGLPQRGGDAAEATASEPVAPATEAAVPAKETSGLMAFSVSLGSYRDQGTAEARVSELAAKVPDVLFTIAPVQVEGEVVHRVLAGPAADSAEALALGTRVAGTAGLGSSDWVARATPRAFDLGEMPELDAALRRSEVLKGLGVPSYVLAVSYDDGSVRFRVYAGAYADESEASYLSGLLQERGLSSATLSDRTGRPPE